MSVPYSIRTLAGYLVLAWLSCGFPGPVAASVLLVSYQATDTVHRYNAETGADLGVFASTGLNDPSGIGYDHANGFVYVANFSGNNIRKYTTTGTDLGVFISSGLNNPESVLVDPVGNVYVGNYSGGGSVQKYNSMGGLVWTLGASSPVEGLTFASNGDILANYYGSSLMRRISPAGTDLGTFVSTGSNPATNIMDSSGNIYLTEYTPQQLKKFSPSGTLLGSVSAPSPWGLAINDNNELLVSDLTNDRIERYSLSLGFLGTLTSTPSDALYMAVIPEPSRVLFLFMGLCALIARRWR